MVEAIKYFANKENSDVVKNIYLKMTKLYPFVARGDLREIFKNLKLKNFSDEFLTDSPIYQHKKETGNESQNEQSN